MDYTIPNKQYNLKYHIISNDFMPIIFWSANISRISNLSVTFQRFRHLILFAKFW